MQEVNGKFAFFKISKSFKIQHHLSLISGCFSRQGMPYNLIVHKTISFKAISISMAIQVIKSMPYTVDNCLSMSLLLFMSVTRASKRSGDEVNGVIQKQHIHNCLDTKALIVGCSIFLCAMKSSCFNEALLLLSSFFLLLTLLCYTQWQKECVWSSFLFIFSLVNVTFLIFRNFSDFTPKKKKKTYRVKEFFNKTLISAG